MRRHLHRIVELVVLAGLIFAGVFIWQHRQQIYDAVKLHNYQPPPAIAQLATDTAMTPLGRHIFYVNHPLLEADKNSFNNHCSKSEQTIVLGCYLNGQHGIFLYAVDDQRLSGIEQVTAAHEMLHAAYDRLSDKERQHLGALLQDFYRTQVHDQRIIDTINSYKQTEPDSVVDEMHSVFGTEIAQLTPELEQHYKMYLDNRQVVVADSDKYSAEFTNRKQAVQAYDDKLQALKQQIDQAEASLKQQQQALAEQRAQLDADRSAGRIDAYNAAVPKFNAQVNAYNSQVASVRSLVNQYNEIVSKRNAIALEEQQLAQAIDSHAAPAPLQ